MMRSLDSAEILLDEINAQIKAKGLKLYIYEYVEAYENEEDDTDPYNGAPMYDIRLATMDEDGEENEDLFLTGCYCEIHGCVVEILLELVERGLIDGSKYIDGAA